MNTTPEITFWKHKDYRQLHKAIKNHTGWLLTPIIEYHKRITYFDASEDALCDITNSIKALQEMRKHILSVDKSREKAIGRE